MEEWKTWLAGVDDDYLIGLSNKGIVKRAYKDKEENPAQIESTGQEVVVKVGGETVNVHYPLGESRRTQGPGRTKRRLWKFRLRRRRMTPPKCRPRRRRRHRT